MVQTKRKSDVAGKWQNCSGQLTTSSERVQILTLRSVPPIASTKTKVYAYKDKPLYGEKFGVTNLEIEEVLPIVERAGIFPSMGLTVTQ